MDTKTLIRGGRIVTVDPVIGNLTGDILVHNGHIAAVGDVPPGDAADAEIIDASGMVVMPGLVDTHRHTWQSSIRHRNGDRHGQQYFAEVIFTIGPAVSAEDVYVGTLLGALSAIDSGTTTLFDWAHIQNTPAHSDAGIRALREAGLRAVFGHGWPLVDIAWSKDSSLGHPEDIRRLHAEYFSAPGLVTLAMSARGPEMTDDRTWRTDLELARDLGVRTSMHVGIAGLGPLHRAVERMHEAGALGDDLIFIHANSCSDEELAQMAEAGAGVSIGVQVETVSQGSGPIPTDRLLAAGIWPSLSGDTETMGTGDMFTQMRMALSEYRLKAGTGNNAQGSPDTLTTADALRMGTIVGAQTLGLGEVTGSLTPGKAADIIMLDAEAVNLAPVTDPVGAAVLAAHPGNVDTVMVDGRILKRHGRLVGVDLERVLALARESNKRHTSAKVVAG